MRANLIVCSVVLFIITSCKNENNYSKIERANWLIGNWINKTDRGTLVENWKKVNDSVYNGESYLILDKDTVFGESVVLKETNNKLTYTVIVGGQNNEEAVRFEMTSITDNKIIFENPDHDFPIKITYHNTSNDSLVAQISGERNGKPTLEEFVMVRGK